MTVIEPAALERRALALIERLLAHPDDARFRERLLRREAADVVAKVARLERASNRDHRMITDLPDTDRRATATPPERFGPFRFGHLIGRGGMGEVWRGERDDGLYDQTVAIKLVLAHLPVRAGVAFDNERRILARLEHPNISRLIDGGTTLDGRACLVMEFVDGVTLDEGCDGQPMQVRLDLFLQAATAVGYAHAKLVAHGDLKPTNILVDRDGRVRLLDFGIARLVGDDSGSLALSGVVTSGFASPQRLAGDPPSVFDDIFALGKILRIVLGDKAPRDLNAIIGKATADDEVDRYSSPADLIADIQRFREDRVVTAVAGDWPYVAEKYLRRRWKSIAVTTVLLFAAGLATWSYVRADHARQAAQARFDETHRLADYILFDLYDKVSPIPGTTRVREQIVTTSHAYLRSLATVPDASVGLRIDMARGYLRLAEVQGLSGNANLGKGHAAMADITNAQSLLVPLARDNPSRADVRATLATALTRRAQAFIYIEHDPARALALARAAEHVILIAGAEPTDAGERQALWAARLATGDALTWLDRPAEALAILKPELAAAQARASDAPPSLADRRLVIRNLRFAGEAEFYAKNLPGAVSYLQRGADAAQVEIASSGSQPSDIIAFANLSQTLGEAQLNLHLTRQAVATLTAAEGAAARLAALDSNDVGSRKRELSVGADLAEALAGDHRPDEAERLMAQVQRGYLAMLRTDASNAALFRAYARSIRPAGTIAREQHRSAEACAWFRRAEAAWRTFDQRWGASASDKADDIAQVQADLRSCS